MPPERLNELLRQRALVQEHLAWLDREIAANSAQSEVATQRDISSIPFPASSSPTESLGYEADPVKAGSDAKRGCLVLFITILLLLGAMLVAIYFWKYRDRPVLFSPRDSAASLVHPTRQATKI